MFSPMIKKLDKSDVDYCRAFISIIKQGKFEIKGDAVQQCGALFSWFNNLDKRIEETIKLPPPETIRKDVGVSEEVKKKVK